MIRELVGLLDLRWMALEWPRELDDTVRAFVDTGVLHDHPILGRGGGATAGSPPATSPSCAHCGQLSAGLAVGRTRRDPHRAFPSTLADAPGELGRPGETDVEDNRCANLYS